VEVVLAVSMGLLVWWIADPNSTDPGLAGKLVAFIMFLNQIFRPLRVIADKFNVLQMGMIAAERVLKVLDNPDFVAESPADAYKPQTIKGRIDFENVSFAYTEPNYVLKNINFGVEAGETVALVGHTGSGKTSIISLLNRLYHIQRGEIRIDGVNVEQFDLLIHCGGE
jgi:ATP-binding cassette subfamily B multidrug efflux pump